MSISSPGHPQASYRHDIDGLRAVAVLAVLLHHAFPNWLHSGFIGVDIFFVISGYLITGIILQGLQKNRFSFSTFYAKRIKRIFPALIIILLFCFVMGWNYLLPPEMKNLGKHILAGATFVANFVYWSEAGYFDAGSIHKPLLHLWSLAIEEQFYIVWPLLLFALHKSRANTARIIFILLLASFLANIAWVKSSPEATFYNPLTRAWELMVGALLAALQTQGLRMKTLWSKAQTPHQKTTAAANSGTTQSKHYHQILAWTGFALLAIGFIFINKTRTFPGFWALFPTLGTALLIAGGPSTWVGRYLLSNRFMVAIGLISYPLYLWHWPLLSFGNMIKGPAFDDAWRWVVIIASIVLSTITYICIEKPIRFGRLNTRTTTIVLCVIMALVAFLGYNTYRRNGYEFRYPQVIRDITSKGGKEAIVLGWRDGDCMLEYGQTAAEYKDFCIEKDRRPLVFLWGDSHAGSLYPGFKALQDSGKYHFALAERSGAICPPILGTEPRPLCQSLNDDTIAQIAKTKPDVVVLYAWWHNPQYQLDKLPATIEAIKKAGVPRIIILGSVPYWQGTLPHQILEQWKKGNPLTPPAWRMKTGLDPVIPSVNAEMQQRAKDMGVEFISGYNYFCNDAGCLTRVRPDSTVPLSYDYGHLTQEAAVYYLEQIAPLILPTPSASPAAP